MRLRTPLLLGALALAVAVLAGLIVLRLGYGGGDSGVAMSLQADGQAPRLNWRVGSAQQYAVTIESSFLMSMPGGKPNRAMQLRMEGVLAYRTLEVDATGVTAGMRFIAMDMTMDGAGDAGVNRALTTPFRVRFDSSGLPLSFDFPAAVVAAHREVLENLVRMFQVVIDDGDSWQTQESNASGRYEAIYASTSPATLEKNKQRYLQAGTTAAVPEVVSVEAITLDANRDWISGMVVDETLVTRDPGSPPVTVKNHATIQLQHTQKAPAANTWRFQAAAPPRDEEAPDTLPATSLTPEEARRQLAANISALDSTVEGRSILIHRVRDLLLVDDQLPEVLLETMRTGDLTDRTRADLYLAFELAGTPAAQAALGAVLMDTSWPPQDALRAIVALGGVARPTVDTLATLWDLAFSDLADTARRDLPGTATLAIGSLGGTLRSSDDTQYLSVRADLLAGAASASKPEKRAVFLYALGNTADPDPALQRDIVPYLDDPEPRVRRAAARTLGKLGTDQVAEELMQSVVREGNPEVRASLVEALASWQTPTPAAMEWTRNALVHETDENARLNMAVMLGNNMAQFPENRVLLQAMLETEQSRRIRQQLAELLY